jgi:[phosphatase 2A protein]-leucine-carboxy methyltransferase
MAAPQIPNLLANRTNTPGRFMVRNRGGRGGSHGEVDEDPEVVKARKDKIVQGTDTDANISRMSAVNAGYLHDPFAKEFATSSTQRRFPIINRGTKAYSNP